MLAPVSVLAQDGSRTLAAGSVLSGAIAADQGAVTYAFDAPADSTAGLTLGNVSGAELSLIVSDVNGNTIGQASASASSAQVEAAIGSGGRHIVIVFFAPGGVAQDTSFDLGLEITTVESAAPSVAAAEVPDQLLLGAGIEVSLSWTGAADLDLEVRDPEGRTLFWNSRTTDNGGSFGFDANGLCAVISESPEEAATWQPGFLPTGSYEIIVYYEQACDPLTATVPFSVDVEVNGVLSGTIADTLAPGVFGQQNIYVARFEVGAEGVTTVVPGGAYPPSSVTLLPATFDSAMSLATPIARAVGVVGEITNARPFIAYSFEGVANELITVDMQATGGSLDTLLQIVDPAGNVVDVNDDAILGETTNSRIADARLLSSGRHTIVATRYAKEAGGTVGPFQLTLTGPTGQAAPQVSTLNLPQGDVEVSLFWSTGADLQLLVRDPVGESVFDDNPLATSGGILQEVGNANCVPAAAGAPVSYVYWPEGFLRPGTYEVEVWYQNPCADFPPPVNFTLQIEVNDVVIARMRQLPQPDQRLVTNFTVQPSGFALAGEAGFIDAGSATLDYQAAALDAPAIASGTSVTGTISPSNTFDVYQFDGVAGETVTISMTAVTLALDTNLYLIGPSGRELVANDDGNPVALGLTGRKTDSQISGYNLPENGPYTIIATRYGNQYGGTIGVYELSLTKT
ncbi:MAG: pre-peptidase C-terminal domain-containing protein [Anaerolineae bacterium]|nr:pre-peptidase C-terminal domain-containing protein [Anaerolineae bacterium]